MLPDARDVPSDVVLTGARQRHAGGNAGARLAGYCLVAVACVVFCCPS